MIDLFSLALLFSTAACGYMTGLVVFVQLVHYPSFHYIEKAKGVAFHNFHTRFTGYTVGLPMLAELMSTFVMVFTAPDTVLLTLSVISAGLLLVAWLETGLRVIPIHNKLQHNGLQDDELITKLVKSNRMRTISWIIRFLLLLFAIKLLL